MGYNYLCNRRRLGSGNVSQIAVRIALTLRSRSTPTIKCVYSKLHESKENDTDMYYPKSIRPPRVVFLENIN